MLDRLLELGGLPTLAAIASAIVAYLASRATQKSVDVVDKRAEARSREHTQRLRDQQAKLETISHDVAYMAGRQRQRDVDQVTPAAAYTQGPEPRRRTN